jgi:hypothetical protein
VVGGGSTVVILRCYPTQVVVGCPLELTQQKGEERQVMYLVLGIGRDG